MKACENLALLPALRMSLPSPKDRVTSRPAFHKPRLISTPSSHSQMPGCHLPTLSGRELPACIRSRIVRLRDRILLLPPLARINQTSWTSASTSDCGPAGNWLDVTASLNVTVPNLMRPSSSRLFPVMATMLMKRDRTSWFQLPMLWVRPGSMRQGLATTTSTIPPSMKTAEQA